MSDVRTTSYSKERVYEMKREFEETLVIEREASYKNVKIGRFKKNGFDLLFKFLILCENSIGIC